MPPRVTTGGRVRLSATVCRPRVTYDEPARSTEHRIPPAVTYASGRSRSTEAPANPGRLPAGARRETRPNRTGTAER